MTSLVIFSVSSDPCWGVFHMAQQDMERWLTHWVMAYITEGQICEVKTGTCSLHGLQRSDTFWCTLHVYIWEAVQKISLQHIYCNVYMATFNNRESTLFYNTVPTKIEAFVQLWDKFINSCLVQFCALWFQPPHNRWFHIVTCKSVARKMIFKSRKEVKITWCQIWAVWQMFQDCPSEVLPELCCSYDMGQVSSCRSTPVVSSPGRCCLMAACNHSRVSQHDAALIVMPFYMKSTNSKTLRSQYTVDITLPAGLHILKFFDRRCLGCFHSMLEQFVSAELWVKPHRLQ